VQQAACDEREIQAVIERVRSRLGGRAEATPAESGAGLAPGGGIHPTVDRAVAAAVTAFEAYRDLGLGARRRIVDAVRRAMRSHAAELARMAHDETGLGRAADKELKNLLVTDKTPGPEDLEPTCGRATAG
jgi:aldehyde dehydrogenase